MFEHKNLDGKVNRVITSSDAFLNSDVLEVRDGIGADTDSFNRKQYGVIGDRLVERSLPPESMGDSWSYDSAGIPWWGSVMNPPHAGIVAEFNSHNGGLHRKPFEVDHNVVAFANDGEEVLLDNGIYKVARKSDGKEIEAASILELRKLYFAKD